MAEAQQIKPAPAAFKADVWTHFGFHEEKEGSKEVDKSHAICKLCHARVKYCGNTTNLRAHLARHHADVRLTFPANAKRVDSSQPTLGQVYAAKLPPTSTRATKITLSIIQFICKDLRPLSVVENEGFRNMITTLEPRYAIPSRQYMTDIALPRLYTEVKAGVQGSLSSAERVALTCDGWTSRATESYVTITAHHITDDWKLGSHVLQTRAMPVNHTGENIAAVLREVVFEWGLDLKDPVVVTDNASNMTVAARVAEMTHIQCFAHGLNLASQKALKLPSVAEILGRVRRVTTFFRRSTVASHQLKLKQELLQLPKHRLTTDVVTRWNSSYDMLARFLEQQTAICAALLSSEVRKSAKDVFTLSEADVTCAEEVLKGMKPMKDAILVMSEEKMPTLSLIAPLHDNLVKSTAEMEDDSATVKEIKLAIAQDLGKRYTNANETLYMASAVDPRFKDLLFLTEQKKTETYSRLTDAVTDVIKKKRNEAEVVDSDNPVPVVREEDQEAADHSPNSKDGTDATPHPPQKKPRSLCLLVSLLGDTYASTGDEAPQSAGDAAAAEVKKFQDETPLSLSGDPLSWWREHEHVYPHLSTVAKRFLCIPGTSVSSERVFSTTGDIVTAQRSVLKAGHVDQLVFLNRNLTIKN
ncbi:E3 SUMO-protein ligase ZBED1-like isoform X2 [Conger conger]|uniref:E3 SUMO-protein ligase ZBED1-like isoform X2 n=1 Tax=Conger conger TaxID=82655 RepID=UPI002A5B012A|nr:E3 SUMO-protein ligase ZBED1-like isoform X2 [Conger conger]